MNTVLVEGVLVAALALAGGIYTARSNRRSAEATARANQVIAQGAQDTETKRVDGEAYKLAQEINREIVDDLKAEVARLRQDVTAMRAQLAAKDDEVAQLRARHDRELNDVREQLTTEVESLRAQLSEAYRDRPNYRRET